MELSKQFDALPLQDLAKLWVQPDIFEDLLKRKASILTGKKGSGKTSIVTYLHKSEPNLTRVLIASAPKLVSILVSNDPTYFDEEDDRVLINSTASLLETSLLLTLVASTSIQQRSLFAPKELLCIDAVEAYFKKKRQAYELNIPLNYAVKLVDQDTLNESTIDDHSLEINHYDSFTFQDRAIDLLVENDTNMMLCLDEIDDVTLPYSRSDRIIIASLVGATISVNSHLKRGGSSQSVLLSIPQELFEHLHLFGRDKVEAKTKYLHWKQSEQLMQLVNKSIAYEVGSSFPTSTTSRRREWLYYFPKMISNAIEQEEDAFRYILRHTQYVPRQVTALIDHVIKTYESEQGHRVLEAPEIKRGEEPIQFNWSTAFVQGVAEGAQKLVENEISIWETLYPNLRQTLAMFQDRPYIWKRDLLMQFLHCVDATLESKLPDDSIQVLRGVPLVNALHRIGFLGLGYREKHHEPPQVSEGSGPEFYRVEYSFLSDRAFEGNWTVATIPSMFKDKYQLWIPFWPNLNPTERLKLSRDGINFLNAYDPELNMGNYRNKTYSASH